MKTKKKGVNVCVGQVQQAVILLKAYTGSLPALKYNWFLSLRTWQHIFILQNSFVNGSSLKK